MKKFFSLVAFLVISAIAMGSQAEAKLWFVSNLSGSAGSGVRFEAGSLLVDVAPSFTKTGATNTIALYADAYMGDWGAAINMADLSNSGQNDIQLQYAKEFTLVKGVAIGGAINVVDYALNGVTRTSGDLKLFQTYSTYLVFDVM